MLFLFFFFFLMNVILFYHFEQNSCHSRPCHKCFVTSYWSICRIPLGLYTGNWNTSKYFILMYQQDISFLVFYLWGINVFDFQSSLGFFLIRSSAFSTALHLLLASLSFLAGQWSHSCGFKLRYCIALVNSWIES